MAWTCTEIPDSNSLGTTFVSPAKRSILQRMPPATMKQPHHIMIAPCKTHHTMPSVRPTTARATSSAGAREVEAGRWLPRALLHSVATTRPGERFTGDGVSLVLFRNWPCRQPIPCPGEFADNHLPAPPLHWGRCLTCLVSQLALPPADTPSRRIPRQPSPGAVHHVISRFVDRSWLLTEDAERARYLYLLGRSLQRSDWRCLAYALTGSSAKIERKPRSIRRG
jgi:hypothetical protein